MRYATNPLYEDEFKQALREYLEASEHANQFMAQAGVLKPVDLEEAKAASENLDKAKKKLEEVKKKYFDDL